MIRERALSPEQSTKVSGKWEETVVSRANVDAAPSGNTKADGLLLCRLPAPTIETCVNTARFQF